MSFTNLMVVIHLQKCSITFQTNKYFQQFYVVSTDNQILDGILKCYAQNPCNWNSTFLLELQSGYSYLLLLLYNSVVRRNDLAVSEELLGSTFELEFCFNLIQSNGSLISRSNSSCIFSFSEISPSKIFAYFFSPLNLCDVNSFLIIPLSKPSLLLLWTSSWES